MVQRKTVLLTLTECHIDGACSAGGDFWSPLFLLFSAFDGGCNTVMKLETAGCDYTKRVNDQKLLKVCTTYHTTRTLHGSILIYPTDIASLSCLTHIALLSCSTCTETPSHFELHSLTDFIRSGLGRVR